MLFAKTFEDGGGGSSVWGTNSEMELNLLSPKIRSSPLVGTCTNFSSIKFNNALVKLRFRQKTFKMQHDGIEPEPMFASLQKQFCINLKHSISGSCCRITKQG